MPFLRFSPYKEDRELATPDSRQDEQSPHEPDETLLLARAIHGAGMSSVASFALQMLKPLHWMGGQALWILQPFLGSPGARTNRRTLSVSGVAGLLEREGGLDELAAHLDRLQSEREYENKEGGV